MPATMSSVEEVDANNAVASSSRSSSSSSRTVAARRRQPSITSTSTPLLRRFGVPALPRILPQCDDRFLPLGHPQHPQHVNPLCSTSNRAVVLALLLVGASYVIHRRYQRWLARRRERMSEVRRRELEKDTDAVEPPAEFEAATGNRAEKEKSTAPGRKKKKGNALLTLDGSTDRSGSSSASPVRNRGKSAMTTGTPPTSKRNTLPANGNANLEDNGDFTVVTKGRPIRSNSSASSTVASPSAPPALTLTVMDDEVTPLGDLGMTSASGKSAKKKKKKNVQANGVNDGAALQRTTSNDLICTIKSEGASTSDISQSASNGTASRLRGLSRESSSESTARASSIPTTPPAADIAVAMAKRELDEACLRHRQELADLQREVARYQTLSEEAQRAEEALRLEAVTSRRESETVKDQLKSLQMALHHAEDEVASEVQRRESIVSELAANRPSNGDDGLGKADEATARELAHLRQENVRLQDDLRRQQATSGIASSPSSRSRESMHHAELNRFRDETNKCRQAERYWRSRAEQSERVISELAGSQTDHQRKLAEQTTACQQLAAQYAQARHIIHQYEVAIQLERSRHVAPSPVSPLVGGPPNLNGGMPSGLAPNAFLASMSSHPSSPGPNGTPMIMLPNGAYAPSPQSAQHLHQASPNSPNGWFETTRGFPSQLPANGDQPGAQPGTPTHPGPPQPSHMTTHASAPDMSTSIAWSVLKNRDSITGSKTMATIPTNGQKNGGEGVEGGESPRTGATSTTSESRSRSGSSPRSTASKPANDTPAETTGGSSDMDTLVNGSPVSNGVSPRRKFSGQLIDIAAAAMERRSSATSSSSRGSHFEGNGSHKGPLLLPSPLEVTGRIASPSPVTVEDHSPDSPTDSGVPLIFASVHHDHSEMEAYRQAMEEQETSRKRDKEAEKSRERLES